MATTIETERHTLTVYSSKEELEQVDKPAVDFSDKDDALVVALKQAGLTVISTSS